ncbi:MAG: sigma-54-dependent Fis family transcriptional regulator [Rhodospirillales bacterium]|nr:sigma-54-dependent Fis family transcriptional regulator [Rhodospirillales bacterium]
MRLLIIGNLDGQIGAAARIAIERGASVAQVDNIEAALDALRAGQGADLIMADVRLDIAFLVKSLQSERINAPVVACGVGNETRAAVQAIRAGAKEYVPLPPSAELIAAVLEAVTEENVTLVGCDPKMMNVLKIADQIAPTDASVLITGASGTGKEMLARHLHGKSRRKNHRFVAVNCAAIPETLLESELFGYEKGAFTGAVARRVGKFEEAKGGTLLLDETSEMDIRIQAKLLRAIQEREIDRLGGGQPVKIDVRILATSNRVLEDEIAQGRFRQDLFFRLNVVNLHIPSLAERPEDISVLAEHFVRKHAEANGVKLPAISVEAMAKLKRHSWPGNVRELENSLHRAVLLSAGPEIGPEAIVLAGSRPQAAAAAGSGNGAALVGRTVADVERELIIDTLTHCLGNRTHAANILGISIRTLRNKLKQYSEEGFTVPHPREGERPAV